MAAVLTRCVAALQAAVLRATREAYTARAGVLHRLLRPAQSGLRAPGAAAYEAGLQLLCTHSAPSLLTIQ